MDYVFIWIRYMRIVFSDPASYKISESETVKVRLWLPYVSCCNKQAENNETGSNKNDSLLI